MKVLVKRFGKLINCESGGVLILVAFAMVVILGMAVIAIDVGSLYQTRRQAVSAADAAALAGAQEKIIGGDVIVAVNTYAITHNGADSAEIVEQTSNTVKVRVEKEAPLWFFPAFTSLLGNTGINTSQVSAEATAVILPLGGMKGLIPIGIPVDNYNAGQNFELITVKNNQIFGPGNWGFVDFDLILDEPGAPGGGVPDLAKYIRHGYDKEKVSVDDWVLTETGNKANSVNIKDSVKYHIIRENIVFVPIVDVSGNKKMGVDEIQVKGFAAVILTEIDSTGSGQSGDMYIKGKFVESVSVGDIYDNAPDYGLYGVALIE